MNPENGHMRMVSMNEYTVYMMGADTNHYGTNLANFWQYNPENYRFEDLKNKFVPVEHVWGYWTNAKLTMRAFHNCRQGEYIHLLFLLLLIELNILRILH